MNASPTKQSEVDVVVIGAGLAGLIASRQLTEAGKTVLILEARDGLGGRLYARCLQDRSVYVDFGGTWIIPGEHAHAEAELDRYGIDRVRTPDPDTFATRVEGRVSARRSLDEADIADASAVLAQIAADSTAKTDFAEALASANASPLIADWMQALNRFLNGCELSDVSARVMGTYPAEAWADPDHYSDQITGTTQTLVNAVASEAGARIRFNTEATFVHVDDAAPAASPWEPGPGWRSMREPP
ncbi:flavin monoamine oxidase family protein [Streptomyces canus]|uniref:flavin monoamine oxidase family protein n=1 Tax=Streptomyces canus TaxID=58343 RepID=UPI00382DD5D2